MIDINLQLDEPTHLRVQRVAADAGMTPAQWIADLIARHSDPTAECPTCWPEAVLRLEGAWADFPPLETLRDGMVSDAPRESW